MQCSGTGSCILFYYSQHEVNTHSSKKKKISFIIFCFANHSFLSSKKYTVISISSSIAMHEMAMVINGFIKADFKKKLFYMS